MERYLLHFSNDKEFSVTTTLDNLLNNSEQIIKVQHADSESDRREYYINKDQILYFHIYNNELDGFKI